jgi:hypothetical protein
VASPLQRIFGDDRGLHRDQRSPFPADALPLTEVERLAEWWIGRVAATWDSLQKLGDAEMFTTSLTLSRAPAESAIVNTSFTRERIPTTEVFRSQDVLTAGGQWKGALIDKGW